MGYELEKLVTLAVDCGFHIHKELGPGLLESVYETVMAKSLERSGLKVDRQKPVDIVFEDMRFRDAFRYDILVEDKLLIELKSTENMMPVHGKQVITYLRLMNLPLGLLINFGAPTYKQGLRRIVNNYTP